MAKARTKEQTCRECSGRGTIDTPQQVGSYLRYYESICSSCDGVGVMPHPC